MRKPTTATARLAAVLVPLMLSLAALGCGTSKNYRAGVHESYPVISTRLDAYDLSAVERDAVAELRAAAAVERAVTYERAEPAWRAVEPTYRGRVAADAGINEQRRADWLKTADIVNELQAAERDYRRSLGTAAPPPPPE